MRALFLLLFLFIYTVNNAQDLEILKKIGTDIPNSDSGLAQNFRGALNDDGNLYFKASNRGWYNAIWKTDGTAEGTIKLFEEDQLDLWTNFHFIDDGILLQTRGGPNNFIYYDIDNDSFTDLASLSGSYIVKLRKYGDRFMMLIKAGNTAELWVTDKTAAGTFKLGEVGEYHNSMKFYCSSRGAVVYNSSSFVDYDPVFYNSQTQEFTELVEYFASFDSLDQVNDVFIHEQLLFINGKYGNYFRKYIFDINSQTFYPFTFLNEVLSFVPYENDLLIITKTQIIRLNLNDYSYNILSEDVSPFSSFYLDNNILYFIQENGNANELCTLNITTQEVAKLENTNFGFSLRNYSVKYKDELYYKSRIGSSSFLFKYDHSQKEGILIDTISVDNGSYTINHALQVVGDRLVTSVWNRELGHELYYLSESTNSLENYSQVEQLNIFPNPANDVIQIENLGAQPYTLSIFNQTGNKIVERTFTRNKVDITKFPAGLYHGYVTQGNEFYIIKFVKG
ncbi:MAG TPA: T9SS type A sorting domain-containing protein [Gracilimonas sp.]|nr:T9SS type A sorting domain-containing protein [Gracilimonas sp.]